MQGVAVPRRAFPLVNFNPGPGEYNVSSERILVDNYGDVQVRIAPGRVVAFNREDRFREELREPASSLIGPGSYNVNKSDFIAFPNSLHHHTTAKKKHHIHPPKRNMLARVTLTTAAAATAEEKSEEISQLLVDCQASDDLSAFAKSKEEKKNKEESIDTQPSAVGPCSYNPRVATTKPRAVSVTIPRANTRKIDSEQKLAKELLESKQLQQQRQLILDDSKRGEYQRKQGDRSTLPGRFVKSELTRLVSQDPKKSILGECNLELLIIRERQLAQGGSGGSTGPSPGQYFNPHIHSSLKITYKQPELQCFESSALRFTENLGCFRNPTGPGQYNPIVSTKKIGGTIARDKRSRSGLEMQSGDAIAPGPGEYSLVRGDLSKNDHLETFKENQSHIAFASAFGSGQRRFIEKIVDQQVPGPGEYNVASKKPKKRRSRTITVDSSEQRGKILRQQAEGQQYLQKQDEIYKRTAAIAAAASIENRINVVQPRGSSQFVSLSERFSSIENQMKIGSDIGPGQYEVSSDIDKQRLSHNKQPRSMMNRSERITDFIDYNQLHKAGPGYYEPNADVVKPKIHCFTKI